MVFVDWQRIDIELTGTNCNAGGWIIVPRRAMDWQNCPCELVKYIGFCGLVTDLDVD